MKSSSCGPRVWVLGLLGLAAAAGCSRDGLVPVRGVVTLDAKPLEGATVALTPTGPGMPARATTDAAGRFEVTVGSGKRGALPGDYAVTVLKMKSTMVPAREARSIKPGPDVEIDRELRDGNSVTLVEYLVPKRYASPASSGLTASVPTGGAELRFDLRRAPGGE